jgi:ubiquinone biosynthesis protein
LQELGPVGVKLGQVLACRPDLLPPEYLPELRKLADEVSAVPFEQVRRVVEEDLGAPLEDIFAEFSEEPSAAASLAQVHKARLRSGQIVAVKAQRPDAAAIVEMDLQLLMAVARLAERYSKAMQAARVGEFALEFAHNLRNELNFYVEAHRTDRLREALSRFEFAKVPLVHWQYTTRRVLTMEWCTGATPTDTEKQRQWGIDARAASRNIGTLLLVQIFELGLFHGDPHSGNILIQPHERIVFLDCGNVQSVSRKMRQSLGNLVLAILGEDSEALLDELLDIGVVSDDTDIQALALDADAMLSRYTAVRQTDVRVGEAMDEVLSLVFKHRVRVPPILGAMGRALLVGEGVCRVLDPNFDFRQLAQEVLTRRWPGTLAARTVERLRQDGYQLARAARLLPRQLARLLFRANAGGLRVRLALEDSDQHLRRLDVMANRLAFALVVAAFIVSSAMIISSERAIASLTPIGGTIYAGAAAVLGLWLLYSILRSGRL